MSASIDVYRKKRVAIVASNPANPNTNFIVNSRFKPHAVRDGNVITGQQQYSGADAARLVIKALGQWEKS